MPRGERSSRRSTGFSPRSRWIHEGWGRGGNGGVGGGGDGAGVPPAAGQSDLPNTGGAFADDNGDYHEAAINAIAAAGITEGCAENLYCPALSVTRAQMASFLARAYKLGTRAAGYSTT